MTGPQEPHSTLTEIDRKLRELQEELAKAFSDSAGGSDASPRLTREPAPFRRVFTPPVVAPTSEQARARPPAAEPYPPPGFSVRASEPPRRQEESQPPVVHLVEQVDTCIHDLEEHLEGLRGLRDELVRSNDAFERQLRTIRSTSPEDVDLRSFEGQVTINAGPFPNIGTLGVLEQALGGALTVADVHVRSFEGNRALVDVWLDSPVYLIREMQRVLPFPFSVVGASQQLLTIDLVGAERDPDERPAADDL